MEEEIESGQIKRYPKKIITSFQLGNFVRLMIFWFVQTILGYDPQGNNTSVNLWGLRIQVGLFPFIIIGIGILIFWRLYKITPEEMEANANKLKDLDL